jgi:hypothetical protein
MKFATRLVLLMFVLFISTPTIVSVIKKTVDTSYFYSMSEEELAHKEIKADFKEHSYHFVDLSGQTSGLILFENLSKHDNVASTIFIPPPEQV